MNPQELDLLVAMSRSGAVIGVVSPNPRRFASMEEELADWADRTNDFGDDVDVDDVLDIVNRWMSINARTCGSTQPAKQEIPMARLERKTLVHGVNVVTATADELVSLVRKLQADKAALEELQIEGAYKAKQIAEIDESLAEVVTHLNAR